MKAKNRDVLVRRILKAMRACDNPHYRQDMYLLADALMASWRDMKKSEVEKRVLNFEVGGVEYKKEDNNAPSEEGR